MARPASTISTKRLQQHDSSTIIVHVTSLALLLPPVGGQHHADRKVVVVVLPLEPESRSETSDHGLETSDLWVSTSVTIYYSILG